MASPAKAEAPSSPDTYRTVAEQLAALPGPCGHQHHGDCIAVCHTLPGGIEVFPSKCEPGNVPSRQGTGGH